MQHSVLCAILPMASECPAAFVPHLRAFFVNETSDALFIKLLKLDVLSLLANQANQTVGTQPQRLDLGQQLISVDTVVNHSIRVYLTQHDRPTLLPLTHADQVR